MTRIGSLLAKAKDYEMDTRFGSAMEFMLGIDWQ